MSKNTDPFAPWNDPMYKNDPFAPHNDPMRRDDPSEPWNDPSGSERDLEEPDRSAYGLSHRELEDSYWED